MSDYPITTRLRDPQVLVAVGLILLAILAVHHRVSETTGFMLLVLIPSVMLHEIAHGVVALACGDDTAKRARRLTLNPIRHVDPVGTILVPAVLALSGLGMFGWAKPVPINPSRMRHPRNDAVLVSLAGPATNLLLAGLSLLVFRLALPADAGYELLYGAPSSLTQILFWLGLINVVLAVFNLLPIPPLDGSELIRRLLPRSALQGWWYFQRYSMIVLLVLVLWDPGDFMGRILSPVETGWANLLVSHSTAPTG